MIGFIFLDFLSDGNRRVGLLCRWLHELDPLSVHRRGRTTGGFGKQELGDKPLLVGGAITIVKNDGVSQWEG